MNPRFDFQTYSKPRVYFFVIPANIASTNTPFSRQQIVIEDYVIDVFHLNPTKMCTKSTPYLHQIGHIIWCFFMLRHLMVDLYIYNSLVNNFSTKH